MALAYLSDETKALLKEISKADNRTGTAEIDYLLRKRAKELGIVPADISK